MISKNHITGCLTGKKSTFPFFPEGTIFVEGNPGRSSSSVDISGIKGARIVLPPVGSLNRLSRALRRLPLVLSIERVIPGRSIFKYIGISATTVIIVITLEKISHRVDDLFVAVSVAMADNFRIGSVRVHPDTKSSTPDKSVITFCPFEFMGGCVKVFLAGTSPVVGIHPEGFAGIIRENGSAVSTVKVPLAIRSGCYRVEGVVMLPAVESGKKDFFFVDCGVKLEVSVYIGKHHNIRRLGNHDLVIEHRNA